MVTQTVEEEQVPGLQDVIRILKNYKTQPCPKGAKCDQQWRCYYHHNPMDKILSCPWAIDTPADKISPSDLVDIRPIPCKIKKVGHCRKNCPKLHKNLDWGYHPLFFRARRCNGQECRGREICPFYHSEEEHLAANALRDKFVARPEFSFLLLFDYKTRPCSGVNGDTCFLWEHQCWRAHSLTEVRRIPFDANTGKLIYPFTISMNLVEELYHPSRYKRLPCDHDSPNRDCSRGPLCAFKHKGETVPFHPKMAETPTVAIEYINMISTLVSNEGPIAMTMPASNLPMNVPPLFMQPPRVPYQQRAGKQNSRHGNAQFSEDAEEAAPATATVTPPPLFPQVNANGSLSTALQNYCATGLPLSLVTNSQTPLNTLLSLPQMVQQQHLQLLLQQQLQLQQQQEGRGFFPNAGLGPNISLNPFTAAAAATASALAMNSIATPPVSVTPPAAGFDPLSESASSSHGSTLGVVDVKPALTSKPGAMATSTDASYFYRDINGNIMTSAPASSTATPTSATTKAIGEEEPAAHLSSSRTGTSATSASASTPTSSAAVEGQDPSGADSSTTSGSAPAASTNLISPVAVAVSQPGPRASGAAPSHRHGQPSTSNADIGSSLPHNLAYSASDLPSSPSPLNLAYPTGINNMTYVNMNPSANSVANNQYSHLFPAFSSGQGAQGEGFAPSVNTFFNPKAQGAGSGGYQPPPASTALTYLPPALSPSPSHTHGPVPLHPHHSTNTPHAMSPSPSAAFDVAQMWKMLDGEDGYQLTQDNSGGYVHEVPQASMGPFGLQRISSNNGWVYNPSAAPPVNPTPSQGQRASPAPQFFYTNGEGLSQQINGSIHSVPGDRASASPPGQLPRPNAQSWQGAEYPHSHPPPSASVKPMGGGMRGGYAGDRPPSFPPTSSANSAKLAMGFFYPPASTHASGGPRHAASGGSGEAEQGRQGSGNISNSLMGPGPLEKSSSGHGYQNGREMWKFRPRHSNSSRGNGNHKGHMRS